VDVERVDDRTACVTIRDDVKHGDGAGELEDVLVALLADGARRLVVDLTAVGFLNSKLLDTLVRVSGGSTPARAASRS
jgi:stage II sporulation protein AA (anti-sigma F factor antagonist)